MSDNKTALTPETLGDIKFRIPLYQRQYAWEAPQVLQLLQDLKEARASDTHYHIGILSVAKAQDVYDLIDGQQRMTTLALIGKASGSHWFSDKLYFYGRPEDNKFLGSGGDEAECNPRMKAAVEIARAFLATNEGLAAYIYKHAAFFLSEVPEEYTLLDKNQQFVRFNNRGRQLEKHEILKIRLINIKNLTVEDCDKAFQTWNKMTELLTGLASPTRDEGKTLKEILSENAKGSEVEDQESLYRAILGVDEFLLIALARLCPESDIAQDKSRLLETFMPFVESTKIRDIIALLEQQTEQLKGHFIFTNTNGYALGRVEESADIAWLEDNKQKLIDVQSFLNVSNSPHRWMKQAFDWLSNPLTKIDASSFIADLERIDCGICDSLSLPQLGEMTYGNIPYYWFYRLDYELLKLWRANDNIWKFARKGSDPEKLLNAFRFRRCNSVEHIVPRRFDGSDAFCNLALISGSSNSAFNSHGREQKMKMILETNRGVESLKMLHFLWSSQSPEEHGKTMYSILENAVNQQKT